MSPKTLSLLTSVLIAIVPAAAAAQGAVSSVLAGTGQGSGVIAQVDVGDGTVLAAAAPFGNFHGGVRVATGDITGDGTQDYILATGNSRGDVTVLDGTDLSIVVWTFQPFGDKFKHGLYVASGDIDGDGRDDVIVGGGSGGEVRVFSGATQMLLPLYTHTPFIGYTGGVTVAAGDIDGDSRDDVITGTATSGAVSILSGMTGLPIALMFPYGAAFTDGIYVAAGDVNDDGRTDLVTGPRLSGDNVRVFSGLDLTITIANFDAYPGPGNGPGITVAAGDVDGDGNADIITGVGTGAQPIVRIFSGVDFSEITSFFAFAPNFHGGVFVAAIEGAVTALTFTSDAAATFQVGVAGSFEVTTNGGANTPAITVSGTLPSGVNFNDNGDGTGTLDGTPAPGTGGTYPLTFTADDGVNPPVDQSFVLTVNEAPTITSADNAAFNAGAFGSFTVTTTGFPAPSLSHTGALPNGVTFTDNTDGTATISGTPTESGTFPLTITAANGVSPDAVQSFTLTVNCVTITVNGGPFPDGFFGVAYGPIGFTQSGGSGSITWSAMGLPAGLMIGASGTVSGTPSNTVLNAAVTITATDANGCTGSLNLPITVRPFADNEIYNGGVGNTQFVVGAAAPATPHVFVNDNVLNGDAGPAPLSVTFGAPANGAVVEGATEGTFIYTPNVGFPGLSDTFFYTLTDGNGVTSTGTVTINLSQLVWYVNSAAAAGDGRSHNPFNNLASAGAASSSGSTIYVHTGAANTPGALAMDADQTLHGAGVIFTVNSLTIPAGPRPQGIATVTLNNNTAVRGINFSTGLSPALTATGVTQPIAIDQVSVTGGSNALSLSNVSGAVTVTNAVFSNTSGAEVLINGGTGLVNMGATIISSLGRTVDIQNRTAGAVTFTGSITDSGTGILLNANTGSTISFTGGLNLTTGANTAFTATAGGTINVTQDNTTIVNTISTSMTALNVTNTTIGAGGVTLRSISSSGGARGIILNNTGSGAFTVSGNGAAGTGGTIQNATGRGAEFISAANISLSYMNFTGNGTSAPSPNAACADGLAASTIAANTAADCQSNIHLQTVSGVTFTSLSVTGSKQNGINGHDVTNISLTGVTVTGNGDEVGEDGLQIANLKGASNTIAASTFRDNAARSLDVHNNAAGSATLTITGGAFGNTDNPTAITTPSTATASDTILVGTNGANSASLTTVIAGASFSNIFGRALHSSSAGNTSQNVTFGQPGVGNGNTVSNVSHGTDINGTTTGTVNYNVVNNTFTNTAGAVTLGARTVINARKGFGATGDWSGLIDGNTIGTSGVSLSGCDAVTCGGISTDNGAIAGNHDIVITNNTIFRVRGHGIFVANNPGVASLGTLRTRIEANTLDDPDDGTNGPGGNQGSGILVSTVGSGTIINVKAGGNAAPEKNSVTGNWGTGGGGTLRGVRFTRGTGSTICVSGHAGPFDAASVAAFITTQNTGNAGSATSGGLPGAFTGPVCPVP